MRASRSAADAFKEPELERTLHPDNPIELEVAKNPIHTKNPHMRPGRNTGRLVHEVEANKYTTAKA